MSPAAHLQSVTRRLGNSHFAIADQLAMVGGNFLMNLILARAGDLNAFGSFSVLYALLVLVNAAQSALIGEPLALSRELDAQHGPRALDGQRASLQVLLPVSVLLAIHAFATMPGLGLFHALLFIVGCTTCSAYWSSKGGCMHWANTSRRSMQAFPAACSWSRPPCWRSHSSMP